MPRMTNIFNGSWDLVLFQNSTEHQVACLQVMTFFLAEKPRSRPGFVDTADGD